MNNYNVLVKLNEERSSTSINLKAYNVSHLFEQIKERFKALVQATGDYAYVYKVYCNDKLIIK